MTQDGSKTDKGNKEAPALCAPSSFATLSEGDRQLLGRLCQAGGGRAGRALATILGGHEVRVELFDTGVAELGNATQHLGDLTQRVVAVYFELGDPLRGYLAMLLPETSACVLAEQLINAPALDAEGALVADARGAVAEVGNIVASAFLNAFADALRRSCVPSPPLLLHALDSEVLDHFGIDDEGQGALTITLEARIAAQGREVRGGILFIPTTPFLRQLLANPNGIVP